MTDQALHPSVDVCMRDLSFDDAFKTADHLNGQNKTERGIGTGKAGHDERCEAAKN
jgi:hypothetical protein